MAGLSSGTHIASVNAVTGLSLGVLGYTHLGYPLVIAGLARLVPYRPRRRRVAGAPVFRPTVSICLPAHNAEAFLAAKLDSLLAQSYPADRTEILVYSDGSTDGTEDVVRGFMARDARVRLLADSTCRGKPTALNRMRASARGEVLVLTDARQVLSPTAVAALVDGLADPDVGCVTGNLLLQGSAGSGFYWRYENWIRKNEARFRSVVGITGPLSALRRVDMAPLPEDVILDDVWIPMGLRLRGKRVILREDAVAHDQAFKDGREFGRKVRTLAGNYQLFSRMPELLDPRQNPSWFETVSHKVMRLVCPFALVGLLASTAVQSRRSPTLRGRRANRVLLAAQLGAYAAAALGPRAGRVPGIARTFVMMHAASVVGLWKFLRGQQRVTWQLPVSEPAEQARAVEPSTAAAAPADVPLTDHVRAAE